MANTTAYDQLLQAQADALAKLNDARSVLSGLQNDNIKAAGYAIWMNPKVRASGGWIDSTGTWDGGPWGNGEYNKWAPIITKWRQDIDLAGAAVIDTTNSYNAAKDAVVKYESSSPVAKAIAATTNTKNIVYALTALTSLGLLITLVVWFVRKGKKAKLASA